MAASQAAALSSKMSTSLRLLLLRQSAARSTAIASSAVSLTGNLPATATITSEEKLKLGENGGDLKPQRLVDWPSFHHHQAVLEAAARGRHGMDTDDDDVDNPGSDDDNMYISSDDESLYLHVDDDDDEEDDDDDDN